MIQVLGKRISQVGSGWPQTVCVLVLALVIRWLGLGAESAWIDEGYSITLAQHSIPDIIRGTASDQHPPLYYLLLHAWFWLGSGVLQARLLSMILGVINVYQVLILGKKIGGIGLGLSAAILLAVNPMHVWYSQEARQYMLLLVLTTAATGELWGCLHGRRRWLRYGLFVLLSFYTQYFSVFIFLAHAVLIVIGTAWQKNRQLLWGWLTAMLGVGLCVLPWLPVAYNQFRYHPTPWIEAPASGDVRDILLRLLLGSGVILLPVWLRWMSLAGMAAVLAWVFRKATKTQPDLIQPVTFLAAWGLIPFLVISVVSLVYPVFQFKQFLILLPAILLLAAVSIGILRGRLKAILYLGLVVIPIVSLVYQQVTLSKDDWRGVSAYIESNLQVGDVVYTNPAGAALVLDLYLDPAIPVKGYPAAYDILSGGWQGEVVTPESASTQLTSMSKAYKRVWLIENFPSFWDPAGELPAWLQAHAVGLEQHQIGNINLRLYRFGDP